MRSARLGLLLGLSLSLAACNGNAPSDASSSDMPVDTASQSTTAAATASPTIVPADEPSAQSGPLSCTVELGPDAARRLVAQCIAVSPATHPPCNAANSCAMIRNEIARSCALMGADAAKTPECGGIDPIGKAAAGDLVDRYYDAINTRDFASAYSLWGPDGGTSGKTLAQFTQGFDQTRRVRADIGDISDVEGAAGSLYVTVPVTIEAQLANGTRQRFTGNYVLRQINRGMGLSQGWHIERASLKPA